MAEEAKTIFLFNTEGRSDKVYRVYLRQVESRYTPADKEWQVYAEWGRRGKTLKGMVKYQWNGWWAANQEFLALVRIKKERGYTEEDPGFLHHEIHRDISAWEE